MATAIVVALAVLLGVGFVARRVLGAAWRSRAERRSLGVIDVLPLGGRRQLVVVRCYDRTLALGIGDREVSLLAELDSDVVALDPKREGSPTSSSVSDFRRMFDRARGALRAPTASPRLDVRVGESHDFVLPFPEQRPDALRNHLRVGSRVKDEAAGSRDEVVA
jgi:flagellar biogenesis protein FliO